jgi:inhibitor of KinA sporulation pathway (predicted exonuclease)
MLTHQERVVAEKELLDDKIDKLSAFIRGSIFPSLNDRNRSLLQIQLQYMQGYSSILKQRIAEFKGEADASS